MSSIPVTYEPPVSDPAEIKTQWVASPEPGHRRLLPADGACASAAESAQHASGLRDRRLVVCVTGQSRRRGISETAGVQAEELRLGSLGIKGNGHMMMVEKNSRQVLQPIIDWIGKNVTGSNTSRRPPRRGSADSLELKLADYGHLLGRH
jgi:hypothetical protein